MGIRYIIFRVFFILKHKSGFLKKRFPINPPFKSFIAKDEWLRLNIPFFVSNKTEKFELYNKEQLKTKVEKIFNHIFTFFSSTEYNLGKNFDWITNPENGYKYDITAHWSEIEDFSPLAGDIKYVWEKSRFSFLLDIIRYDHHFNQDSSAFVFSQIEDFVDKNPINAGPNYKCSQEISIRILNWTLALFYYKNSANLSGALFEKIINSIYWQLHHVYNNIHFSRIAVRNNHAITETAMLYLSAFIFPFIPETKKWSRKGREWLKKEIAYQIYNDGSYLQFSHNYHRVIIQVLTWVLKINALNNVTWERELTDKLKRTLIFLYSHQDFKSGELPNYGNNDGALFFPLNSNHYRDFRPQLQAFGLLLGIKLYDEYYEDAFWYGLENKGKKLKRDSSFLFKDGGFYGFRDNQTLTTIRCGAYKDRPSQADALHLDIWHNGINMLIDPGTYKYNTDEKYLRFYMGTIGHNTLTIDNEDQMLKGKRFIWYYWTKYAKAEIKEYPDRYVFKGEFSGFPTLGNRINHQRTIIKYKDKLVWRIIDRVNYSGKRQVKLHWNINPKVANRVKIIAKDKKGNNLNFVEELGWYSDLYGQKSEFKQSVCLLNDNYCETLISIQE